MKKIKIEAIIKGDKEKIWRAWNDPEHIKDWAFASDDWEAPKAENDLRAGGRFLTRMAAKDGSAAFDFTGTYTKVIPYERIEYEIDDGRTVAIDFENNGQDSVKVTQEFEMESINTEEVQRGGWQAILDNFKKYFESQK